MMFALWNCTVNDKYHKKKESKCIVPQISQVCGNKFTLYKLLKLYHWEIMTICLLDRFVLHYKHDSFWALHMNLINSTLLFLKTDWLPCASCLVTHTLAPRYNVTLSGAIINLMANLTA